MPDTALALANEVDKVRNAQQAETEVHKSMPADLYACLMGKQNDDQSKRARFGSATFRMAE